MPIPILRPALAAAILFTMPPASAQEAPAPSTAEASVDLGHQAPRGFGTDLAAAREASRKADRPLLVMFCTPHCGPCNALKRSVLPRPEVCACLAEYELAYVDAEADRAAAAEFKVRSYPTFVLLTPGGRETGRFSGGSDDPAQFLEDMEALCHRRERLAGLETALKETPGDPALLLARSDAYLDAAEHASDNARLLAAGLADLKAAAAGDPAGKTRAAAELAWMDLETALRRTTTQDGRGAVLEKIIALRKEHPDLRRDDIVLWTIASALPREQAVPWWLELVKKHPDSPQADQGWRALEKALAGGGGAAGRD